MLKTINYCNITLKEETVNCFLEDVAEDIYRLSRMTTVSLTIKSLVRPDYGLVADKRSTKKEIKRKLEELKNEL